MWCQLDSVTLRSLGRGESVLESAKKKVITSLPFAVSGILRLPLLNKNTLPSADFCGINEVVNKSAFIRDGFISTLLPQREYMPKYFTKWKKKHFDL